MQVSESLRRRVQNELLARSRDTQADLRARLAAGRALGKPGDPRFERPAGHDYLLPPEPLAGKAALPTPHFLARYPAIPPVAADSTDMAHFFSSADAPADVRVLTQSQAIRTAKPRPTSKSATSLNTRTWRSARVSSPSTETLWCGLAVGSRDQSHSQANDFGLQLAGVRLHQAEFQPALFAVPRR